MLLFLQRSRTRKFSKIPRKMKISPAVPAFCRGHLCPLQAAAPFLCLENKQRPACARRRPCFSAAPVYLTDNRRSLKEKRAKRAAVGLAVVDLLRRGECVAVFIRPSVESAPVFPPPLPLGSYSVRCNEPPCPSAGREQSGRAGRRLLNRSGGRAQVRNKSTESPQTRINKGNKVNRPLNHYAFWNGGGVRTSRKSTE